MNKIVKFPKIFKIIKVKINNKITKFKQKINDYFLLKNSLEAFSNALKKYYVFSVGFDEIYYKARNPKRFKLCILACIMNWIASFYHLIWISSDYLWSKTDGPFLPEKARIGCLGVMILLLHISVFKTDLILGRINCKICPFKIFYPLMKDAKSIHKLTDRNYKKLSVLSLLIIICTLNYAGPLVIILSISLQTLFTISLGQLYWYLYQFFITPIYINMIMSYTTGCCLVYIYFPYYKFRFDQLNDQIKSVIPTKIFINLKIGKQLINLIRKHNQLALEVNRMNILLGRTAAVFFITLSLIKIISLYLMIHMKHLLLRILVINVFVSFFFFGFGMSLAFSLQIKSAHKSIKLIY